MRDLMPAVVILVLCLVAVVFVGYMVALIMHDPMMGIVR